MNEQESQDFTIETIRDLYSQGISPIIIDYLTIAKELESKGRELFLKSSQQQEIKTNSLEYQSQNEDSQKELQSQQLLERETSPVKNHPKNQTSLENITSTYIPTGLSLTYEVNRLESTLSNYSISSPSHFQPRYAYQKISFNYRMPELTQVRETNYSKYLH